MSLLPHDNRTLSEAAADIEAVFGPDLRRQTQSNTTPGNCYQTAVACVLDLPADDLPDQVAIEAAGDDYFGVLQAFVWHHRGLGLYEVQDWLTAGVQVREPGWHVMSGTTVRTAESGMHHAIVGRYGQPFWDPHPSRAGLLTVLEWSVIAPVPERLLAWKRETMAKYPCRCSICVAVRLM